MRVRCSLCSTNFEVHTPDRQAILIECPACRFVGLLGLDGSVQVASFQEERTLPRMIGHPIEEPGAETALDVTVLDRTIAADPALPPGRAFQVKVLNGPRAGEVTPLVGRRTVIGRKGRDTDVAVDDAAVSRRHCVIEILSRENVFLRDLASTNGTLLNGARVGSKKLIDGDRIRVGATEFLFSALDV